MPVRKRAGKVAPNPTRGKKQSPFEFAQVFEEKRGRLQEASNEELCAEYETAAAEIERRKSALKPLEQKLNRIYAEVPNLERLHDLKGKDAAHGLTDDEIAECDGIISSMRRRDMKRKSQLVRSGRKSPINVWSCGIGKSISGTSVCKWSPEDSLCLEERNLEQNFRSSIGLTPEPSTLAEKHTALHPGQMNAQKYSWQHGGVGARLSPLPRF